MFIVWKFCRFFYSSYINEIRVFYSWLICFLCFCFVLYFILVICERFIVIKFIMCYCFFVIKKIIKVVVILVWVFVIVVENILDIFIIFISIMWNILFCVIVIFCIFFIILVYFILYCEICCYWKMIKIY